MEGLRTYSRKPKAKTAATANRFSQHRAGPSTQLQKENRPHRDWREERQRQKNKKKHLRSLLDSDSSSDSQLSGPDPDGAKDLRHESCANGANRNKIHSDSDSELESTLADFEQLVQGPMERSHGSFVNIMVPRDVEISRQLRLAKYCRRLQSGFECKWMEGYLWITNAATSSTARAKISKKQREMRVRKGPISKQHTQAVQQQSLRMLRRFSLYHTGSEEGPRVDRLAEALQRTNIMEEIAEGEEEEEKEEVPALAADQITQIVQFLDPLFILNTCQLVCKSWMDVCRIGYNCAIAAQITRACLLFNQPEASAGDASCPRLHMEQLFPSGSFLGDGSFKQVFKVRHRFRDRAEAVSVMNLNKIAEYGNAAMVSEELNVSLMLSELVTSKKCPCFIETYQIFASTQPPPAEAWHVPHELQGNEQEEGQVYVYSNMELCDGGDLEGFLKLQENEILNAEDTRSALFQMIYAIRMGQDICNLRHFDVKLLNYFVKTRAYEGEGKEPTCFELGELTFSLSSGKGVVVKLADYGTAEVSPETLHSSITSYQFTTLENTPIEFLLFPDAKQDYSADLFALGLCVLHLFTGSMPYEEIMEEVRCPEALMAVLDRHWRRKAFAKTVKSVLDEPGGKVLYDTLYRYMVLLGIPESSTTTEALRQKSSVFSDMVKLLGYDTSVRGRRSKR